MPFGCYLALCARRVSFVFWLGCYHRCAARSRNATYAMHNLTQPTHGQAIRLATRRAPCVDIPALFDPSLSAIVNEEELTRYNVFGNLVLALLPLSPKFMREIPYENEPHVRRFNARKVSFVVAGAIDAERHSRSSGDSRRLAAMARSCAALAPYLFTICLDRHPASRIRSPSSPPPASQAWANV
jgi:hypothetical protein